jgi:putative membrane protein
VAEGHTDETRDATRRTRLASERTYLAWWRTGLTALAVSLGAGRLAPELTKGAKWPFEVIGVAFALAGFAFIGQAYRRQKQIEDALARGEYAPLANRSALSFTIAGLLLSVAMIVLVVTRPG